MASKNIVLLHGWGSSTLRLAPLARQLAKKGWTVFVPKLPGFEEKDPRKSWTLDDYAIYVKKVANDKWKNEKYVIFGHSFGGRIAIKIAAVYPKKIKAVVLCGAGGISRGNIIKRVIFFALAKVGKLLALIKVNTELLRRFLYKLAREHDYEKTTGAMRQTFRNVVGESLKPLLKEITLPTLILWGKNDRMTPVKDAYYIKRRVKNSKIITYKGAGHSVYYDNAVQIADEIDDWVSKTK